MVKGPLSDHANTGKWIETLVKTGWPAVSGRHEAICAAMRKNPREYVDLRVFKRNEANVRQPILLIGNCTGRYGTYGGASQYGL